MRSLRLPEGMVSVSVFDQTFGKNGVIRDVEDHIAREIMAHDPRITEFTPDGDDDPERMPGGADRHVAFLARVASLDRTELFAIGRSMKISLPATQKTEVLREIVIKHAIQTPPEDLPMIVGNSIGKPDGAVMMDADLAASPNQGNDALGKRVPGPGNAGATFSQTMITGTPEPAKPAPSGVGMVTGAGTQQPPFNQLSTDTGKPAHDSRLAAYPISVPPINPETGQPFEEGDPRIPATARPALREPAADHAEHVTNAAVAISEAADRLSDATAAIKPGKA